MWEARIWEAGMWEARMWEAPVRRAFPVAYNVCWDPVSEPTVGNMPRIPSRIARHSARCGAHGPSRGMSIGICSAMLGPAGKLLSLAATTTAWVQ